MNYQYDRILTFKEKYTSDEVHGYCFPLIVRDGIRMENNKIRNNFHLNALTSVIIFHKALNIILHFFSSKVEGTFL